MSADVQNELEYNLLLCHTGKPRLRRTSLMTRSPLRGRRAESLDALRMQMH